MDDESRTDRRLLRALVAEDDAGVRRLIAALLELDGWDVREAADGDEAVAMAHDWQPDAVVIDVMMPGKDGLTALREIRKQPGGEDRAVVVVSAKPGIEQDAKDAGSDDFMAKPFDPDELPARTRAALRWKEGVPDPAARPPAEAATSAD
jgi:DNA-binding response OmpR family regulator